MSAGISRGGRSQRGERRSRGVPGSSWGGTEAGISLPPACLIAIVVFDDHVSATAFARVAPRIAWTLVLMSVKPLTTLGETVSSPAFSPDGNFIAFSWSDDAHQSNEKPGIFTMSVAGSTPTRVTSGVGGEQWPAWSPDGSHIAFVRSEMPGRCGIFLGSRSRRTRAEAPRSSRRSVLLAGVEPGWQASRLRRPRLAPGPLPAFLSFPWTLSNDARLPAAALRFAFSPTEGFWRSLGVGQEQPTSPFFH